MTHRFSRGVIARTGRAEPGLTGETELSGEP
jgi:hypothetical protein